MLISFRFAQLAAEVHELSYFIGWIHKVHEETYTVKQLSIQKFEHSGVHCRVHVELVT